MGLSESQRDLLNRVGLEFYSKRDEKSFNAVYKEYKTMIKKLFKKRVLRYESDITLDECYNLGMLEVWRGIGTYDPTKATINTWITTCMMNSAMCFIRQKAIRIKNLPPVRLNFDMLIIEDEERDSSIEEIKESMIKISKIYPIEMCIIQMTTFDKLSQLEIATMIDQNVQFVKNRNFNGKKYLKRYMIDGMICPSKEKESMEAIERFDYLGYLKDSSLFSKEKLDSPKIAGFRDSIKNQIKRKSNTL